MKGKKHKISPGFERALENEIQRLMEQDNYKDEMLRTLDQMQDFLTRRAGILRDMAFKIERISGLEASKQALVVRSLRASQKAVENAETSVDNAVWTIKNKLPWS